MPTTTTSTSPARNGQTASRVETLLAEMTLPEKIGQMTQLTLETVSRTRGTPTTAHTLDAQKLEAMLVEHHVGSLLNVWDLALEPAAWHEMLTTIQKVAIERTRLGIPVLYGIDAMHGANYTWGATLFPHNLTLAAAWNPDLVRQTAEVTAQEVRACGIPWAFAPVLDLGRQPLWSRFFETFGEDVHLATVLGRAAVAGLQGDDLRAADCVAACAKHYLGYSAPVSGRDRTPAWIPEPMLREYFLPVFASAIEAGVRTIMVNSGEINGIAVHASRYLLTDVLRDELGFTGVVVTDWEDINKLHTIHRVAESERQAVHLAIHAGIDMSMAPFDLSFQTHLADLVAEGAISESRIDQSVRRILTLKIDLGLFEEAVPPAPRAVRVGTDAAHALSLKAARESIVLTENDGTLPLPRAVHILLTGPAADARSVLHGSWSYTWQGSDETAYPAHLPTLRSTLEATFGTERLHYLPGTTLEEEIDIAATVAAAREVDVVVACLGEKPSVEKPGDIEDLYLPDAQHRLAEALIETGTPTVLVLAQGRPRLLRGLGERAAAVVLAGLPGPHGAEAIAEVLSGAVNPGGRLPFTYPGAPGELVAYDHKWSDRVGPSYGLIDHAVMDGLDPQWAFGYGLSYTSFAYADLVLATDRLHPDDVVEISVTVANTGDRSGHEVVQVYIRDCYASMTPPVKRLRAFQKVHLEPGEAQRLNFEIPVQDLAFINQQNEAVLEPGDFEVEVAQLRASFVLLMPQDHFVE